VGLARTLLAGAALLCLRGAAAAGHPPVAQPQVCVSASCHASVARASAAGGSAHEPAAGGDCASCHDLALPAGEHFVRGAPRDPAEGPESARAWDLALCVGCHGETLYARDARVGATAFADGTRNLHALHVQAGRGRRCLTCHEPHAAVQPRLLRERIPALAGARIAQQFRGEPKGGWCRTGCHAPKGYRR
jgi:predicted CXXCH cytochrome family protein